MHEKEQHPYALQIHHPLNLKNHGTTQPLHNIRQAQREQPSPTTTRGHAATVVTKAAMTLVTSATNHHPNMVTCPPTTPPSESTRAVAETIRCALTWIIVTMATIGVSTSMARMDTSALTETARKNISTLKETTTSTARMGDSTALIETTTSMARMGTRTLKVEVVVITAMRIHLLMLAWTLVCSAGRSCGLGDCHRTSLVRTSGSILKLMGSWFM